MESAGVWKVDQDREKVALQPGHLVSPPSVCYVIGWKCSVHSSLMGELVLNSDAPPLVASVPSLQVTLTKPLMHIH